jgi:hypothetical protein
VEFFMKRFLLTALAAGLLSSGAAQATSYAGTYAISNSNGLSIFNQTGVTITSWSSVLTVSDANGSSASLLGTAKASNGQNYGVSFLFTGAYQSGSELRWSNLTGALTQLSNGAITKVYDIAVGQDGSDARLGINAAPYNANTTSLEFGFWGSDKVVGGLHNFDMNTVVSCIASASGGTGANANGTCKTGGTGGVPLPGTVALLGIAALGLGFRAKKRA